MHSEMTHTVALPVFVKIAVVTFGAILFIPLTVSALSLLLLAASPVIVGFAAWVAAGRSSHAHHDDDHADRDDAQPARAPRHPAPAAYTHAPA